jgi:hypothetical protein
VAAVAAGLVVVGIARAGVPSGKQTLTAESPLGLYTSTSADRAGATPLHRAVVSGKIHIVATAGTGDVKSVAFWLDNPAGDPLRIERVFPYDYAGGAADGSANAFDTGTVGNGPHLVFAEITLKDDSLLNAWASFTVDNGGTIGPAPTPSATPVPTPTPSSAPTSAAPKPQGGGKCPLPAYPTAECTGVPAGTKLTTINGEHVIRKAGTVIEGKRITGDLIIQAGDVKIRNSEIHGRVRNIRTESFEITDSTVGPPSGCESEPAVAYNNYVATRVHIRNSGDGFRNEGDNISIQDSYVSLCSNPGDHSDGIQGYHGGGNVTVRHTTFDQSGAGKNDVTSPIFFADGSKGATIQDNLFIGGGYTVRLYGSGYTFTGNMIANKSCPLNCA